MITRQTKYVLAVIYLIINAVAFLPSCGIGLIMIPIMPLMLAGFSTDSGDDSMVVPIIGIGYLIVCLWAFLLFLSIRTVVRERKLRRQDREK
ncbi:hypothetical protein J2T17_004360 [Paenibacillus mucilaginosus]|uniref:hypothetical protein n=1 Tax=Paenibacillus mucilaginosus TaxID=61624 RepID=UPI003D1FD792